MRGAARGRGLRRGPAVLGALLASLALRRRLRGRGCARRRGGRRDRHRRDRVQPADGGRDLALAAVRGGEPRDPAALRLALRERGPRQDHRIGGHRRRRVRHRHDLELRDPAVGAERLADRPAAATSTPRPGYDAADFIPTVRDSLSYQGSHVLGAVLRRVVVPHVPQGPVRSRPASRCPRSRRGRRSPSSPPGSTTGEGQRRGICLRGKPGWGEVMAPLDTVINTFGGRWFDPEWRAQLDLPGGAPGRAVLRRPRPPARRARRRRRPASPSARTQFGQGQVAMWYDATSAAGTVEDPDGVDRRRADRVRARPGRGHAGRRAGCTPGRSPSRRPPRARTRRGSSCPG